MCKKLKKICLSGIIIVIIFISGFSSAEAFSLGFNPVTFIQKTANTVISRISDIVYYMVMQKRYTFQGYTDPNVYPSLEIPSEVEKVIGSTTPTANSSLSSTQPIPVTTSTIPNTTVVTPVPRVTSPVQTVIPTAPPVLVATPSPATPAPVRSTVPAPVSDYENNSGILLYTNNERADAGLLSLKANKLLDKIAALRAEDLFSNQYFEHESPDGNSASELAKDIDYEYLLIGENLALGNFGGDRGIVSAWMDSPGHRANILNGKYTELGVAVKEGEFKGEETIIAVQIFGLPLSTCAKPSAETKKLIDSSTLAIKKMQTEASILYNNLNNMKNEVGLDKAYYLQKIQEYNYFAKKVNDAVTNLKVIVDSYNIAVAKYNSCIK